MVATELLVRVSELAALRREYAQLQAEVAERRAAFDAEHAILLGTAKIAAKAMGDAETALKAVAEQRYAETQDKNLCPGVLVKEFDVLHYDVDMAFSWAQEKDIALIPASLDKKTFERIAKAAPGTAGSYIIVESRIQIATDLDKALSGIDASQPEAA